ncbi:hypothetical protein D3C72_1515030 [compost metagenome]
MHGRDLGGGLHRIAAIDEDRRAIPRDDGQPPGSREAGGPGQPFVGDHHILGLMSVPARDDESVEAALCHLGAEAGEPRGGPAGGDLQSVHQVSLGFNARGRSGRQEIAEAGRQGEAVDEGVLRLEDQL